MKKSLRILILAAVFVISAAAVVLADGWEQSNGSWIYQENGTNVTNQWRTGADGKWRYLDGNGYMAVNTIIDGVYYVDSSGIMAEDGWVQLNDNGETAWFYFQTGGKMVQAGWKQIGDKWYYFDYSGHMLSGWILDNEYYCDPAKGYMKTGWQKLEDPDDSGNEPHTVPGGTSGDSENVHWYYFLPSGKKFVPENMSGEFGTRTIDGKKYCFDEKGAMQTGWVNFDGTEDISGYRYYNEDGTIRTGWYSLNPPEKLQNNYENDVVWYYFSNTGVPSYTENNEWKSTNIKRINNKKFLFNMYGTPVYGLRKIGSDTYYFGTSSQLCMQTGKVTVIEGDGNSAPYYFGTTGIGYTGVHDSYLYYKGKAQIADKGAKCRVYHVNGNYYLVNESGKLIKNTTYKDSDNVKYKTNSSGIVTKIDDQEVTSVPDSEPNEPVYQEN